MPDGEQTSLLLCGAGAPERASGDFGTCPRQPDHDGEHYTWCQLLPAGRRRGRNAVWVYTHAGVAVAHAHFDGHVDDEMVGALVQMLEFVSQERASGA